MSSEVRKVGSITILMWIFGLTMMPVVGYVASNAIKIPAIEVHLGSLVKSQQEMVSELKIFRESNVAEHRAIAEMVSSHTYGLDRINERYLDNIDDIKECQEEIDHIKNGYGN